MPLPITGSADLLCGSRTRRNADITRCWCKAFKGSSSVVCNFQEYRKIGDDSNYSTPATLLDGASAKISLKWINCYGSSSSLFCIHDHRGQLITIFWEGAPLALTRNLLLFALLFARMSTVQWPSSFGSFWVSLGGSNRRPKPCTLGMIWGASEWRGLSAVTCSHGYQPWPWLGMSCGWQKAGGWP